MGKETPRSVLLAHRSDGLLGRGQVASQWTTANSALLGAARGGEEWVGKSHLRAAPGRGRVGIAQRQSVCSSAGGVFD